MMDTVPFTLALIMGLTGSLHCAGMCGPIVWVMPFQGFSGWKKALAIGLYHLGRISVYALLAVVLYSFRSFFHPSVQQYVSIGIGAILLVTGILTFFSSRYSFSLPWDAWVKNMLGKVSSLQGVLSMLFAGILNGLLPCGLTYMALSGTVTATNPLQAALLMYSFGLGTIPFLVSLSLLRFRLRIHAFRRFVPVVMFAFGTLFLVRGMNLGIPYLSPKLEMSHGVVKGSCCHKH